MKKDVSLLLSAPERSAMPLATNGTQESKRKRKKVRIKSLTSKNR